MLALLGTDESDIVNWGRMRMLASYKMVKRLTEIKPKDVPYKVCWLPERKGYGCELFSNVDHF